MPFIRITLSPYDIRSSIRLPFQSVDIQAEDTIAGVIQKCQGSKEAIRVYWEAIDQARSPANFHMLNKSRRALGLSSILKEHELSIPQSHYHLGLYPPHFGLHDGTEGQIESIGFVRSRIPITRDKLPDLGDHYIVYSTGTGIPSNIKTYSAFTEICKNLEIMGVFLSKTTKIPDYALSENVRVIQFCNVDQLLRGASLLIHHGGVGTIADCIYFNLPQIIIPRAFDQFDNAARVEMLQLGRRSSEATFFKTREFGHLVRDLMTSKSQLQKQIMKHDLLGRGADEAASVAVDRIVQVTTSHAGTKIVLSGTLRN